MRAAQLAVARVPRAVLEVAPQLLGAPPADLGIELSERRDPLLHDRIEIRLRPVPVAATESVLTVGRDRHDVDPRRGERRGDAVEIGRGAFGGEVEDLGEVLGHQPEGRDRSRLEEEHHLAPGDALHLAQPAFEIRPVVQGQRCQRGVERTVAKRQRVGHELDCGRGARGALAQHRQRRITGDDEAIVGFVVAGTGADVHDPPGVAERGGDLRGEAWVGAARRCIRAPDRVVTRHGRRRSSDTISIAVNAASSPL